MHARRKENKREREEKEKRREHEREGRETNLHPKQKEEKAMMATKRIRTMKSERKKMMIIETNEKKQRQF